jgi:hypothetical protein
MQIIFYRRIAYLLPKVNIAIAIKRPKNKLYIYDKSP